MILTRKLKAPWMWVILIQFVSVHVVFATFVVGTPLMFLARNHGSNPIAVQQLLALPALTLLTIPLGLIIPWLSDRIWTRWGRRRPFIIAGDALQAICLFLLPLSPNFLSLLILYAIFTFADSLDSPRGALIYEIIPPRQRARGQLAGNLLASVLSFLAFYFLLGRLNDIPTTGPFALFDFSYFIFIFWLAAAVKLGSLALTILGIREVYPPNRRRLYTGRKPGEPLWRFFPRAYVTDCFAARPPMAALSAGHGRRIAFHKLGGVGGSIHDPADWLLPPRVRERSGCKQLDRFGFSAFGLFSR